MLKGFLMSSFPTKMQADPKLGKEIDYAERYLSHCKQSLVETRAAFASAGSASNPEVCMRHTSRPHRADRLCARAALLLVAGARLAAEIEISRALCTGAVNSTESNRSEAGGDCWPGDRGRSVLRGLHHAAARAQLSRSRSAVVQEDQESVVERARLVAEVERLDLPAGALDSLIDRLGGKAAVAEMPGRRGRMVRTADGKRFAHESRSKTGASDIELVNVGERNAFMEVRPLHGARCLRHSHARPHNQQMPRMPTITRALSHCARYRRPAGPQTDRSHLRCRIDWHLSPGRQASDQSTPPLSHHARIAMVS